MSARKRLILHLGLPRTGTTSIQNVLRGNDAALKELGIWYPTIGPERYVTFTGEQDDLRKKTIHANLSRGVYHMILSMAVGKSAEIAQGRGFRVGIEAWTDFLDEFAANDCHTAIVSFEGFGAAPQSYDLGVLKDALSRFDYQAIIYHRSYDAWVKSLFEQYIRGQGRFSLDLARLLDQAHVKLHPFTHRLDLIRKHLLVDRVIVRSFERAARSDTLVQDFFEALGLEEAWSRLALAKRPRANAAFSPSQTLALHQINRWGIPDEAFIAVRTAFGRNRNRDRAEDPYSIISAEALERLHAMAAGEADDLRTHFGIEPAVRPPPAEPLPHLLGRERFRAMIESVADAISPATREELLRRSDELDP